MTEFVCKHFDELSSRELYEILRARQEVFLLEQGIVCLDLDRVDYGAYHCFLVRDGSICAYLRAYTDTDTDDAVCIGRVLAVPHSQGLGTTLMRKAMPILAEKFGLSRFSLHAQLTAENFYARLGFCRASEEFLEEGVPHVTMTLDAK